MDTMNTRNKTPIQRFKEFSLGKKIGAVIGLMLIYSFIIIISPILLGIWAWECASELVYGPDESTW